MNKTTAGNIVFAKGGVEYIKPLPVLFSRSCFSYCFFINLDNLKKHLLRLVEIELSVKFSPPFANTFSVICYVKQYYVLKIKLMNKTFLLFIVISSIFCKSQTNRFIYELEYRNNSSEDYRKNLMALDINPTSTKFYDYDFIEYDSINKNSGESRSRYSTKTDQLIVRQPNSFRNKRYRDFFDYFVEETNDELKWKLFPNTQMYNEYKLQKATTEFGGRKWIAWFSNDVNISEGPYKFRGLPGLIFLLQDSENNFVYKLVKNNKLEQTYNTNEFLETHYSKTALPISSKKFNKYIEEIYQNPQRMFSDRIKSGEKATFKNETVESIDELNRKKTMLQNGIKGRYIYIEQDSKPNFGNK